MEGGGREEGDSCEREVESWPMTRHRLCPQEALPIRVTPDGPGVFTQAWQEYRKGGLSPYWENPLRRSFTETSLLDLSHLSPLSSLLTVAINTAPGWGICWAFLSLALCRDSTLGWLLLSCLFYRKLDCQAYRETWPKTGLCV